MCLRSLRAGLPVRDIHELKSLAAGQDISDVQRWHGNTEAPGCKWCFRFVSEMTDNRGEDEPNYGMVSDHESRLGPADPVLLNMSCPGKFHPDGSLVFNIVCLS
jgi:hypothetical protein